ncbi:hypothetical protein, partial [Aeromonas caviae]|uniref:hypothetical protein n=1 Tax=Aeromonas caviae TaxID=648 RepID=UPI001FB93BCF
YDARRQQGDGGGVFGDSQFTSTLSVNFHFPKIPRRTYFKRKQFAFECMHWLIEAGYLHGKAHAYEYIENAVLTAKGLEVLKATPDSLQESLGERMQEAAKSGMGETARALIGQVVSLGVGLVT